MTENTEKIKKPFYKKWWVWVIAAIVLFGVIGSMGGGSETPAAESKPAETPPAVQEEAPETEPEPDPEPTEPAEPEPAPEPEVPSAYKSALKSAENYSKLMHMSKQGIYDQLTSEYGDKFAPEAAQYAIDNMTADWNENALKSGINYQELMSMSPAAIYDQLISEYGDQFTPEEAQYAVDNLP